MPTVSNRYDKPRPTPQSVKIEHSLSDPYRLVDGERVYAEKINRQGNSAKLGESYRNVYR